MVVGVLTISVYIHESRSLKAKRAVVRKLKDRVKNNFNVSIAEVGALDKWQVAHIGVTAVGNDQQHINGKITYLPVITAPNGAKPFVKEWLDEDG